MHPLRFDRKYIPLRIGTHPSQEMLRSKLDPKVVKVYTQIGVMLRRYKSGKLPKAMKILPMIDNWEELLYLTKPESAPPFTSFLTEAYSLSLQSQ